MGRGEDAHEEEGTPTLDQGDAAEEADVQATDEVLPGRAPRGDVLGAVDEDKHADDDDAEQDDPEDDDEEDALAITEQAQQDLVAVERETRLLGLDPGTQRSAMGHSSDQGACPR